MTALRSGISTLAVIATLFVFTTSAVLGNYFLVFERIKSRNILRLLLLSYLFIDAVVS